MELIYLWIEEYKNIKREGFNFSPRFQCRFFPKYEVRGANNYKKEMLIDNCILEIIDKEITKEDYPKNIFDEKINLTAIVGENGAGKSSLLEILSNKYSPVDYQNLFFIFYNKKNKKLTLHGAKHEQFGYIKEKNLNQKIFEINLVDSFQEIENTKTVYFSNILNENDLTLPMFFDTRSYSHTVNISTTQILNQMKSIETKYSGINSGSITGFDKIYRSYRIQEIQRAIILIKDKAIKIPFELPISLEIKNIDFKSHIENAKNKFGDVNYKEILDILDKNNDKKTLFKNYLSANLIISLLLENANSNNPILEELLRRVLDQKLSSSLEDFYNNVKNALYNKRFNVDGKNLHANYINDFFDLADKILFAINDLQVATLNGVTLVINIADGNFDFLEAYEKLIQQSEYFWDVSWRGLSSGEEAFLYQFSRLYFLKKGFKDDHSINLKVDENKEAKNIILLVDEGEITLHPHWQKDYIKYLVNFLKNNFDQDIHLILTSHSPFILSDLPKENVVFLEKGKQVYPTIETFGANIHTLLSHGFFMKDGLMGEFAKEKIQSVINFLNGDKNNKLNKQEAWSVIQIIGEPFLKYKLEEKFHEKFSTDDEKRTAEIKRLEEELERLKNVKSKD